MHKTKIIEIGPIVPEFAEEFLVILFGPEATPELREICVIHEVAAKPDHAIREGGTLTIGNQKYQIAKVGEEANANYEELGHVSIYFRNETNAEVLPGAILVTPEIFPEMANGDVITFE
jgi:PTS system glucitol/sorbitol-specific IIA component